jgi:hypothetical protein
MIEMYNTSDETLTTAGRILLSQKEVSPQW